MRREFNAARQPDGRHAVAQRQLARGARALDGSDDQADFLVEEALMKVSRLALLLGEEFLGLSSAFDQFEEIAKSRLELRNQNVGQPLPGLFLPQCRGLFGSACAIEHGFDDGPKERLLGFEVMIKRLPGQSALLSDQFHGGEPVTVLAEDLRRGIENAFTGTHVYTLDIYRRNVKWPSIPLGDRFRLRVVCRPLHHAIGRRLRRPFSTGYGVVPSAALRAGEDDAAAAIRTREAGKGDRPKVVEGAS